MWSHILWFKNILFIKIEQISSWFSDKNLKKQKVKKQYEEAETKIKLKENIIMRKKPPLF